MRNAGTHPPPPSRKVHGRGDDRSSASPSPDGSMIADTGRKHRMRRKNCKIQKREFGSIHPMLSRREGAHLSSPLHM